MRRILLNWKVHLFALIFVIIAEAIHSIPVNLPFTILGARITFFIFPMLIAMTLGIIAYLVKLLDKQTVSAATPFIGIATMWLIAVLAIGIGPRLSDMREAGWAFVLQEFGNLGMALLAVPVAVFIFSMGRQAIGASFSKSREPSIAIISNMYGLNSPEGQGVMGAYIVGTVLGTLFCGILASIVIATGIFDPIALAMGAGSGSASMMIAFLAPMEFVYPDRWEELQAVASMSNLITAATGIYFSMFITIPVCKWMYKVFDGEGRYMRKLERKAAKTGKPVEMPEEMPEEIPEEMPEEMPEVVEAAPEEKVAAPMPSLKEVWIERAEVLVFSGVFAIIGNFIFTTRNPNPNVVTVMPHQSAYALLVMAIPVVLGCLLYDFFTRKTKINLPAIIYISLLGIILGIPGMPLAVPFATAARSFGLLPLATPILAYAGISLGKDLKAFKESGVGIIVVTLLAFTGTYLGSAIIAHVYLVLAR